MLVNISRWETLGHRLVSVTADGSPSNKTLLGAELIKVPGDKGLEELFALLQGSSNLRALELSSRLAPAHLPALTKLTQLESLDFPQGLSRQGLEALSTLPKLTELSIDNIWERTSSFDWLAKLPRLEVLHLAGADDAVIDALASHRELRELHVRSSSISARGLATLARLPHLWALGLGEDRSPDEAFASLRELKTLRVLTLPRHNRAERSGFGDGALEALEQVPLELLVVDGCSVTDKGIASLERMSSLKWVEVKNAPAITEGVAKSAAAKAISARYVIIEADDAPVVVRRKKIAPTAPVGDRQLLWWETA